MVVGNEHSLQADIIFVIEGTATNGAYINDLKTNYIIPTLECFTQGTIDERDYISENSNAYGIVVYQAADCLPHPSSDTFGPFSNASRVLNAMEKLELIGGKGESHANIAEGIATALQCFDELQHKREPGVLSQKHCILVCNSPPYALPVMESYQFSGKTAEQLAAILLERGINLSILSPRKIPALFKLFEKAGGDLSTSQTKNYAKDPRHLVLLKGFCLKERPISPLPGVVGTQSQPNPTTNISLPSPLSNNDSPMSTAQQTNQALLGQTNQQVPSSVGQGPVFRPNQIQTGLQQAMPTHSQSIVSGMVGVNRPGPNYIGTPQFNQQQLQPPGYPGMVGRPPRWPMMPPQPRQPCVQPIQPSVANTQSSALIAQLTQPPSSMSGPTNVNVNQFGQMNNAGQMNPQQAAIRMTMLNNQNTSQQTTGPATMSQTQQSVSQTNVNVSGQQQQPQQQTIVNQQVSAANPVTVQTPVTSQANASQQNQQMRERQTIWHGVLEWIEKPKNPTDQQKLTRHVPCSVSAPAKDGEPELKADNWPQKLIMQLMPKQLIGSIGGMYLRNSKSVLFHPQNCEALESLTKVMSTGFAGCVHFTSLSSPAACDIKVLILLYTAEKRAYLGFIPNDQAAFVDRLRKVIQQQKSSQQLGRQGQVGTGVPGSSGHPTAPNQQMGAQQQISTPISQPPNSQQGIMMSQTNTMAMGGGQITQNVVTSTSQPNQSGIGVLGQQVNPSTMSPRMSLQGMPQQGPPTSQNQQTASNQGMRPNMIGVPQQRPPFDHLEAARQQNLEKIVQLKQTLEAAQQQEAQYKSQLEIISHMKTQQLQEALQVAQQQEMQFKLQMEMQQQQQRQITPQGGPQSAANQQQRMMRPVLSNNPGLRHLLQQQPQYRQQIIGMQQMSGAGPRPQQMGQQMQNTTNQSQQQQFDDVSSFDFM